MFALAIYMIERERLTRPRRCYRECINSTCFNGGECVVNKNNSWVLLFSIAYTLASSMVGQIYSSRRTSSSSDLSYSNLIFTVITNLVRNNKLALRSICILKKWGMILSLGRITTDKVWGSSIEYTVVLSAAGFQVSRWILKTFQVDFCTPHGLD